MASKKKSENEIVISTGDIKDAEIVSVPASELEKSEIEVENQAEKTIEPKSEQKYSIGSIVFVSKDADADLNGFKLFPQYKKCTYTVESYDGQNKVYSLRRLNLLLKLKEADIVAPHEKESSSLVRKQY